MQIFSDFENYDESVIEAATSMMRLCILDEKSRNLFIEKNGIEILLHLMFGLKLENISDMYEESSRTSIRKIFNFSYKAKMLMISV